MTTATPEHSDIALQPRWISYLIELRRRLLLCISAWIIVFLALYYFSAQLYSQLAMPLLQHLSSGNTLIATSLTGTFLAPLKLAMALSLLLCMPLFLQQLWRFICPSLYKNERFIARILLLASIALFYLGLAFAYYLVFPMVVGFFTRIAPYGVAVTPDISSYLNFSLNLLFAFGLAFEMPIFIIGLVWSKIITVGQLRQYRPHMIVINFIIAMFLTPPDVISQTMLAIPLCLLFEGGLLLAKLIPND